MLALVAFHVPTVADDEWSRFRGPNGTGVTEGVSFPAAWTPADYKWQVALPGAGHSSPIGWGDQIYIASGQADTGKLVLAALDAETGATRWSREFDCPPYPMHQANHVAASTPAADGERVYFAWATPQSLQLAALTHAGGEAWRRDLGPVDFKHGFGASPIVHNGLVIMPCDHGGESFVVALDAATGDVRWRTLRGGGTEAYATPAIYTTPDGAAQIIVHSTAEGMAALAPADGAVVWQLPRLFPVRCVNSPLVAGELVVGGSGEGGSGRNLSAVRPPVSAGDEPAILYELRKSMPQVLTPLAIGDRLFVWHDKGVATCCNLHTGEIVWTERAGDQFYSSPVAAGGKIYGISVRGEVIVLAATDKFEVLGRTDLGEPTEATPAIHRGAMYIRTAANLACLPAE